MDEVVGVGVGVGVSAVSDLSLETKVALAGSVAKGYAWLLERGPLLGLEVAKVDTEILALGSDCKCVLGQLGGGNYGRALLRILEAEGEELRENEWAMEHGFFALNPHGNGLFSPARTAEWGYLTQCWRELIDNDRTNATAAKE